MPLPSRSAKLPDYNTPRGTFIFPHIQTPDAKFAKESARTEDGHPLDAKYKTTFRLSAALAAPIIKRLEEVQEAAFQEVFDNEVPAKRNKLTKAPLPFSQVYNDQGEETGFVDFKFQVRAGGVSKKTQRPYSNKPVVFDSLGKPTKLEPYSGAEGKVRYVITEFYSPTLGQTVSLKPKAVQIIKLAKAGDKDASSYGFEQEQDEDAFEARDNASPFADTDTGDSAPSSADRDALL